MTDLDPDRHLLPEAVRNRVQYNTAEKGEYRLFIRVEHWRLLVPYYDRLVAEFPKIKRAILDDGIHFGTSDREVEKTAARLMGVVPVSLLYKDMVAPPEDYVPRGRPKGSGNKRYPFDELVRIGDCFLVRCDGSRKERVRVSVTCSERSSSSKFDTGRTRRYASHQVEDGVLVVLIYVEGQLPARVVEA